MKLLWFSHFIPYPPKGGAHQRSYNLLRLASGSYDATFVGFNLHGYTPGQLSECEAELRKYCSCVEFWQMPIPWKSPRWGAKLIISPLQQAPYSSICFWSRELDAKWTETLRQHQGALVHFDSIDLALFANRAAGFRKVLNHHNCESAMAGRRAEVEPNPAKKLYLRLQARKLKLLERTTCHLFDLNLAVSEADAGLLESRSPKAQFQVVENGTDTDYFVPSSLPVEPNSLIFAGSLNWYPNISAIQFLVREVWPEVKLRRPGVRLYVVGMKPSEALARSLRQDPQITVVNSPPDIRPWVAKAAVFVFPTKDGGGTKVKLLDAMAMGKTIVSTSIGCEGLDVKHGENILVADTAHGLSERILEALDDPELRRSLGTEARALVERKYAWCVVNAHLEEAYRCACSNVGTRDWEIEVPGAQLGIIG